VGRVCPRHSDCARPLNSVVKPHEMGVVTFSVEVLTVVHRALMDAQARGHRWVTVEHMALALLQEESIVAFLRQSNTDVAAAVADLDAASAELGGDVRNAVVSESSSAFQQVVGRARGEAEKGRQECVLLRDLLLSIVDQPKCRAASIVVRSTPSRTVFEDLRRVRAEENNRAA
jgi:ATP-dependent Clp protease ATP-binding subunit ClpA